MVSSAKCALSMLRPFQTHLAIPRRIWRMKSLAISNLREGSRQMNMTRLYDGSNMLVHFLLLHEWPATSLLFQRPVCLRKRCRRPSC
ncbi:hypothetical protein BT96DRAFT_852716 [Gymnopus androsaceus JB14]|uniref:Uncharacterized protein n=1 Tax=Gymnopus androsaceus JB14 TaxID=1447944 RepID=A0A6A4I7H4_9AGAR|nr:hypothetical protein BT96DRAFT_852716 [Gymnopus androsaceus JB14]